MAESRPHTRPMLHLVAKSELSYRAVAITSSLTPRIRSDVGQKSEPILQTTLRSSVTFSGVGLHSGRPARMVLRPASAEYGIWFRRTDVIGTDAVIPAHWDAVTSARLCTVIGNAAGVTVSTIEHIMAALVGCGIHNVLIEIDGPEVPILDGSAAPFVAGIMAKGVRELNAPLRWR